MESVVGLRIPEIGRNEQVIQVFRHILLFHEARQLRKERERLAWFQEEKITFHLKDLVTLDLGLLSLS